MIIYRKYQSGGPTLDVERWKHLKVPANYNKYTNKAVQQTSTIPTIKVVEDPTAYIPKQPTQIEEDNSSALGTAYRKAVNANLGALNLFNPAAQFESVKSSAENIVKEKAEPLDYLNLGTVLIGGKLAIPKKPVLSPAATNLYGAGFKQKLNKELGEKIATKVLNQAAEKGMRDPVLMYHGSPRKDLKIINSTGSDVKYTTGGTRSEAGTFFAKERKDTDFFRFHPSVTSQETMTNINSYLGQVYNPELGWPAKEVSKGKNLMKNYGRVYPAVIDKSRMKLMDMRGDVIPDAGLKSGMYLKNVIDPLDVTDIAITSPGGYIPAYSTNYMDMLKNKLQFARESRRMLNEKEAEAKAIGPVVQGDFPF